MGWSVGYRLPPESDLIDEILLAAGKALYLANLFESKCSDVLRTAHLVDLIQDDPVVALEQASALLPSDKMLGRTLQELFARTDINVSQEHVILLEKAREARNYIAHQGASAIGELWGYGVQRKLDALRELRIKVINLAKGDNIVSKWYIRLKNQESLCPLWRETMSI